METAIRILGILILIGIIAWCHYIVCYQKDDP